MPNSDIFLNLTPATIDSLLLSNRSVMDGEPVNAAVTNRLPGTNQSNVGYLHELLKKAKDNSGEFLWGVPVANDVLPGHFVYFDSVNRVFAKALTKFYVRDGQQLESEASAVWGVVVRVHNNEADICTSGLCTFQSTLSV